MLRCKPGVSSKDRVKILRAAWSLESGRPVLRCRIKEFELAVEHHRAVDVIECPLVRPLFDQDKERLVPEDRAARCKEHRLDPAIALRTVRVQGVERGPDICDPF